MAYPAPKYPVDLSAETPAQKDARLAWERERIAEAEDDIINGRVVGGDAALEWLDRWAAGDDLNEPDVG